MKNKISSQIMFYFNIIVFNINFANITYSSLLMNNDAQYSWLIPLFCILLFTFIIIFFKKKPIDYQNIKNTLIYKFIIFFYTTCSLALIIYFTSLILTGWFYEQSSIFLFIVSSSIIVLSLALFKTTSIIRVGFFWAIGYIIIALIGITIRNETNIMLLFPISLKYHSFIINIFYLIIPLDNLLYLFIENPENNYVEKKTLYISGIIILLFCSFQLITNLTLVNYKFYEGLSAPTITTFFMYYSKNHIGHYDIILIINILTTLFYKGAMYGNFALQVFPKKKRALMVPFLSIIVIIMAIEIIYFNQFKFLISYINLALILCLYLIIIFYQRRDNREKNTKL